MKLVRTALAAIAIILALTQPSFTEGQNYPSQMIVFGDSLSDTGNDLIATSQVGLQIPPLGMYYFGRFTNGPVALEYLWAMLRNAPPFMLPSLALPALPPGGAVSFAYGGTGSGVQTLTPGGFLAPGLLGQVQMFQASLHNHAAPANALYAIWTGPNDYPAEPWREFLEPEVVVGNIATAVRSLYQLGARKILLINMPEMSAPPDILAQHNSLLHETAELLDKRLGGLQIIEGDVVGLLPSLVPEFEPAIPLVDVLVPPAPGAPYPNSFCLFIDPTTCPTVPTFAMEQKFLFWDAGHPTTAVHERAAEVLFEQVRKALRNNGKKQLPH
jgi:phospholipase/lecithinase/hemolysin